jgi:hypothetical protein
MKVTAGRCGNGAALSTAISTLEMSAKVVSTTEPALTLRHMAARLPEGSHFGFFINP